MISKLNSSILDKIEQQSYYGLGTPVIDQFGMKALYSVSTGLIRKVQLLIPSLFQSLSKYF